MVGWTHATTTAGGNGNALRKDPLRTRFRYRQSGRCRWTFTDSYSADSRHKGHQHSSASFRADCRAISLPSGAVGSPWSYALWSINSRSEYVLDEGPDVAWKSRTETDVDSAPISEHCVRFVNNHLRDPGITFANDTEFAAMEMLMVSALCRDNQ